MLVSLAFKGVTKNSAEGESVKVLPPIILGNSGFWGSLRRPGIPSDLLFPSDNIDFVTSSRLVVRLSCFSTTLSLRWGGLKFERSSLVPYDPMWIRVCIPD